MSHAVAACAAMLGLVLAAFNVQADTIKTELVPDDEFEVVGELYAYGVNIDAPRKLAEVILLDPMPDYGSEIVSCQLLPVGSRVRIISKAPKRWFSFLYSEAFIVQSDAVTNPAGLQIKISLVARGETPFNPSPLNPSLYKPVPKNAPPPSVRPVPTPVHTPSCWTRPPILGNGPLLRALLPDDAGSSPK